MLNNIGTNEDYTFAGSSDIQDFIGQMNQPKQDMQADEYEGIEELEPAETPEDDEPLEPIDTQMKAGAAKDGAPTRAPLVWGVRQRDDW